MNATERERRDLINELQIMVTVGEHPNVVSLIGACTRSGKQNQQIISTLKIYMTTSSLALQPKRFTKPAMFDLKSVIFIICRGKHSMRILKEKLSFYCPSHHLNWSTNKNCPNFSIHCIYFAALVFQNNCTCRLDNSAKISRKRHN